MSELNFTGRVDLLATINAQRREIERLDARVATLTAEVMHYTAGTAHPPVTVRGEPMACPCGKCGPDGPVVVYGELKGYFGER